MTVMAGLGLLGLLAEQMRRNDAINAYGTGPLVPIDWFIIAELIAIFGLGGLIVLKVIY